VTGGKSGKKAARQLADGKLADVIGGDRLLDESQGDN